MSNLSSLTARQQFWLAHLQSCAARGESLTAYATEEGLSVGALQQAKRRLQRGGLWPSVGAGFVRVQPAIGRVARAALVVYRVSLPNGVVVESESGDLSAVLLAAARLP
jgi:hypothetical protein